MSFVFSYLILFSAIRFKTSDALEREVTRLVRNNPVAVNHIPTAINFLVTAHSVEADAPEVKDFFSFILFAWIFLNVQVLMTT